MEGEYAVTAASVLVNWNQDSEASNSIDQRLTTNFNAKNPLSLSPVMVTI